MSMNDLAEREERPAYVEFEARPVTDKAASLEAGMNVSVDQDWALVTPPYSKDRVEQKVLTWFSNLEFNAKNGRIPGAWVDMYKKQYNAWKEGQEIPLDGTPIRNWAIPSPAQVKNLLAAGMKTVEDLALCNDEGLRRLGMGGIDLRNKAKAFLASANSVVTENAALKTEVEQLKGSLEAMQQQISIMVGQGARTVEVPVIEPEPISASDIMDEPVKQPVIADEIPAIKPKKAVPKGFGVPAVQDPKLVAAYIEKFGKKPNHLAKDATIRKKLEE